MRYQPNSKIIYLSIALASSIGPLELSLTAFSLVFKLGFFKATNSRTPPK